MIEYEKRYLASWWFWVLLLVVVSSGVLGVASYAGLFGQTVAKRVIFENSFQYKEARKSEIITYNAQLEQINIQLSNPNLTEDERVNLEAQKASINVLLRSAEERK